MRFLIPVLAALLAQQPSPTPLAEKEASEQVDFICPMDKDVRTKGPGKCPRCGMKLVAGIPDPHEYPVTLRLTPKVARPGKPVDMEFRILDPKDKTPVKKFEIMHDKLFHLFMVSDDLSFFAHEHPEYDPSGLFRYRATLPKPGAYRIVADYYPSGGTPQFNVRTIYAAGKPDPRRPLVTDLKPQKGTNLEVSFTTEPAEPLAGFKTLLFFQLKQTEGEFKLEPYLGAWGHMLAASEDLVDLMHTHPFIAEGGPKVQFNLIFPREGMHRVWVQFQSKGVVNTVAFSLPVKQLR